MNLLYKIFFVLLLFASTEAFAQLPANINFEKGNFDGWECFIGTRNRSPAIADVMDPGPVPPRLSIHTIVGPESKDILDDYGHFPVLCPNGSNYSVILGNAGAAGKMQRISYTLKVPSNVPSYSIVFNYAVVLENPLNHPFEQQPIFTAKVYNVTDDMPLACPSYEFTASGSLVNDVGFKVSDKMLTPGVKVYYKDWSTAMINLTNYAGKYVRIEFTAQDCKPGSHFGYAYLDFDENLSAKPVNGDVFCDGESQTTLIGPAGFAVYKWYKDGDLNKLPLTGQSVTVPADDGQPYTLEVTPYPNLGCPDYLNITLQKFSQPFNLVVADKIYGCPDIGVDLTASTVTAGSTTMKYFKYYKDPGGLEYLLNSNKVTVSGTNYIKGTNACGRTDIKPVQVIIDQPEINIVDHINIQYPAKVDFASMFTHQPGYTYNYYKDADAKEIISSVVNTSGTYYIQAINNTQYTACSLIVPVKVVVNPPPPYTIDAPNTFTPNGDGVNDLFKIKIDGFGSLTQLTIFDRYGQQVFTTRSINDYWTGNRGSNPLPVGTYYWIFEGTDDYYHTKVKKSGTITIIR